jgi:hypothetical protein
LPYVSSVTVQYLVVPEAVALTSKLAVCGPPPKSLIENVIVVADPPLDIFAPAPPPPPEYVHVALSEHEITTEAKNSSKSDNSTGLPALVPPAGVNVTGLKNSIHEDPFQTLPDPDIHEEPFQTLSPIADTHEDPFQVFSGIRFESKYRLG